MKRVVTRAEKTVSEAFEEFMVEKCADGVSPSSVSNYKVSYKVFIEHTDLTDNSNIESITQTVINQFKINMQATKKAVTINHYLIDIRAFVNWCIKQEYIETLQVKLMKVQEAPPKVYSDESLAELLKAPDRKCCFSEHRTYAIVAFILGTGARAGTVSEIKLSDIDFNNREVTYRHLKTRQTAVIPLSQALIKILQQYINEWQRDNPDGYLFCDCTEGKLTVGAMRNAFEDYCTKRNIKSLGIHALRHTFAKNFIVSGGNAFALQKCLCHSSLDMTKHYCQLFGADIRKDVEDFSPLTKFSKPSTRVHR